MEGGLISDIVVKHPEKIDQNQDRGPDSPDNATTDRFVFPKWVNLLREGTALAAIGGLVYVVVLITGVFSPEMSAMGYAPEQPVPYSHALHAGDLGIDCRYCHSGVEVTAQATLPPTATCMNCHATIKTESPDLDRRKQSSSGWAFQLHIPPFISSITHLNWGQMSPKFIMLMAGN